MDRRRLIFSSLGAMISSGIPFKNPVLPAAAQTESATSPVLSLAPESTIPQSHREYIRLRRRNRYSYYRYRENKDFEVVDRKYTSWSLFLISNPAWLTPASDDRINALFNAYTGYARAIGDDHAAVFFWKTVPAIAKGKLVGMDFADKIDSARCAAYTKAFKLDIAQSPHVLVTRSQPTRTPQRPLPDFFALSLGQFTASSAERLLTTLAQQLIQQGYVDPEELDYEAWWLQWRDRLVETAKAIGQAIAVTLRTGPVELQIRGSQ